MKHFILLLTFLFSIALTAQTMRETRAVWVSTNFRLDWPPRSYDENVQKKELIKILRVANLLEIYYLEAQLSKKQQKKIPEYNLLCKTKNVRSR